MYAKFEWIIHELKMLCGEDIKSQYNGGESIFRKEEEDWLWIEIFWAEVCLLKFLVNN